MKRILLTLGLISLPLLPLFPQNFSMTLNGGVSQDLRFFTSNAWKTGYALGTDLFFIGSGNLRFGAHLLFHHWTVDGEGLLKDETKNNMVLLSSLGSRNLFELFPTMRWYFSNEERLIQPGLQVSAGVLLLSGTTPQIRYSYYNSFESGTSTVTYTYKNPIGYGITIGFPINIAGLVQIMPTYCVYVNDYLFNHISLMVGVSF